MNRFYDVNDEDENDEKTLKKEIDAFKKKIKLKNIDEVVKKEGENNILDIIKEDIESGGIKSGFELFLENPLYEGMSIVNIRYEYLKTIHDEQPDYRKPLSSNNNRNNKDSNKEENVMKKKIFDKIEEDKEEKKKKKKKIDIDDKNIKIKEKIKKKRKKKNIMKLHELKNNTSLGVNGLVKPKTND